MFRGGAFQGGRAASSFVTRADVEEAVAVASEDDLLLLATDHPDPWLRDLATAELALRVVGLDDA